MKPAEFSEQLQKPETRREYVEQGNQHALELIDNISKYWHVLEEGLFLDDDNGGIVFRTGKWHLPDSGREIDGLEVRFKDPDGVIIPLGAIHRNVNDFNSVAVMAYYKSRETNLKIAQADRYERIDILDARWEAIVGSVEAVLEQLNNQILPSNLQKLDAEEIQIDLVEEGR